jgi:hypothetical protein
LSGLLSVSPVAVVGPQGERGSVGATGPQGPAARDGRDGADSTVPGPAGKDGQSIVGSAGPQGPRGDIFIPNESELQAAVLAYRQKYARIQAALLEEISKNLRNRNASTRLHISNALNRVKKEAGLWHSAKSTVCIGIWNWNVHQLLAAILFGLCLGSAAFDFFSIHATNLSSLLD